MPVERDNRLQFGVSQGQNRTIRAAFLQHIRSEAPRAIDATAMLAIDFIDAIGGCKSRFRLERSRSHSPWQLHERPTWATQYWQSPRPHDWQTATASKFS
jgi:hypothetical protein